VDAKVQEPMSAVPGQSAESRWPPIAVMLSAVLIVTSLPGRYQAAPFWFPWTAFILVAAPMAVLGFRPASIFWHRAERAIVFTFVAAAFGILILALLRLLADMLATKHGFGGLELLESAASIWVINMLVFALLYWQIDRGGPEARAFGRARRPDFIFGESEGDEADEEHRPHFIDYLFLAFATSTSFTPPDYSKPSSPRAKLFAMTQASVSLLTLVLVASRAVATLS
jgi:hypothetical protein